MKPCITELPPNWKCWNGSWGRISALIMKLNQLMLILSSKMFIFFAFSLIIWYSAVNLTTYFPLHFAITIIRRIYFLMISKHSLAKVMLNVGSEYWLLALKWTFVFSFSCLESEPLLVWGIPYSTNLKGRQSSPL